MTRRAHPARRYGPAWNRIPLLIGIARSVDAAIAASPDPRPLLRLRERICSRIAVAVYLASGGHVSLSPFTVYTELVVR